MDISVKNGEVSKVIDKYFFECVFIDGTKDNFSKLCTAVEEFGNNNDMIMFKAKNFNTNDFVVLQIIPKHQIRQIINHYVDGDINKIFEN